jgi:DNA-directed RNA polymerase subunit alpha
MERQEIIAKNWRELIRPRELETDTSGGEAYGKFACEPLERGFGLTLGNALRRVLLSSLQGAAITSVKIGGVLHEFSTIPGVMEDVADIVLNLKEVRLRLHGEGPKILRVHQKGRACCAPKDLSEDPTVEVMNPDKKIATLSADADVELEITVDTGKGYVGAEKNKSEDMPIGTIRSTRSSRR